MLAATKLSRMQARKKPGEDAAVPGAKTPNPNLMAPIYNLDQFGNTSFTIGHLYNQRADSKHYIQFTFTSAR